MQHAHSRLRIAAAFAIPLLITSGCFRSAYYAAMEQIGKPKREILADRVRAGQEDQREAEEQFLTTFELFKQTTGFDGGDLEDTYTKMDRAYQRSEDRAERVRTRIDSIEQVAGDLFEEWEAEISLIESASLRRGSEKRLAETRKRYATLVRAMRRAEERMDPVLRAFRDQVLFLKHNLNAKAIASLQSEVVAIEDDVAALIQEMRASIREAESFLASVEN